MLEIKILVRLEKPISFMYALKLQAICTYLHI